MKIEPAIVATPIASVSPGTFVQFGAALAIAAATARQPPQTLLALYDAASNKFLYTYDGIPDEVLVFRGEVVALPDLSSQFEGRPDQNSTSELYLDGESPHVVIHVGNEHRLLNLSDGVIESSARSRVMIGFRNWGIGVRNASGALTMIKSFPANSAAAFLQYMRQQVLR